MWQGKDKILQKEIAGAINQNHITIHTHHFLQGDQPTEITEIILEFLSRL